MFGARKCHSTFTRIRLVAVWPALFVAVTSSVAVDLLYGLLFHEYVNDDWFVQTRCDTPLTFNSIRTIPAAAGAAALMLTRLPVTTAPAGGAVIVTVSIRIVTVDVWTLPALSTATALIV